MQADSLTEEDRETPETEAVSPPTTPPSDDVTPSTPDVQLTEPLPVHRIFGLSRSDAIFSLVVGTALIGLSVAHWARLSGWGTRPIEVHRLPEREFDYRVDVNRATWVEWMQIDGIGEATARRIVADREERGPFASLDDLLRVKGIGPKTLEKMQPRLVCPDCAP